jgi:hypothetical protein
MPDGSSGRGIGTLSGIAGAGCVTPAYRRQPPPTVGTGEPATTDSAA